MHRSWALPEKKFRAKSYANTTAVTQQQIFRKKETYANIPAFTKKTKRNMKYASATVLPKKHKFSKETNICEHHGFNIQANL